MGDRLSSLSKFHIRGRFKAPAGRSPRPSSPASVTSSRAPRTGAALGPTVAAPFLDVLGPRGLFLYSGIVATGLAAFVLWRMSRRASPPAKEGFVDIAATTPRVAEIDPRVPENPAA